MSARRVLALTRLDKNKKTYKVLLEGDLNFPLLPEDLRRFRIEEDGQVPEEAIREIEKLVNRRARDRVLDLLEFVDKTEAELRTRLEREGYPPAAVDEALEMALHYGYVNDHGYGLRYARVNAERKSRHQIMSGLLQKGISRELAEEIVKEQPVDEEAQIRRLLEQKGYWGRKLDQKERQRAAGMLARRGYSFDAAEKVLGQSQEE